MSKYIKLEDAIHNINLEVVGRKEYTGDMKANLFFALDDLPTIEVSEDVLKATKNFNAYTIADENAEMGMRTKIEPIIEVSEDCISREYVKCSKCDGEMYYKYDKDEPQTYITEDRDTQILDAWQVHHRNITTVEDAPSVVPSEDCISRAEVIAEFERRKDKLYEDDYFDELMWIIENITDVVPSRAEGEWIKEMHTNIVQIWKCDQCAEMIEQSIQYEYPRWNYCPNCGARMKG